MIPLTDEENKSQRKPKVSCIFSKRFIIDDDHKVRDHCDYTRNCRGAAHSIAV